MKTLQFLKEYWGVIVSLFSIVSAALTVSFAGLWYMFSPYLIHHSQEVLGINEIREFIGANKISFQPLGQSYVKEPVHIGENLILIFSSMRTQLGKDCRYIKSIPIFTSSIGVVYAGEFTGPGRQVGTELRRTEISMPLPEGITPGRTVLELELHYTCPNEDGEDIFTPELTRPMVFSLLERE